MTSSKGADVQAIRVVLCSTDSLFVAGLRALLERQTDLTILTEVRTTTEALSAVQHYEPDIVVIGRNDLEADQIREISAISGVLWISDEDCPQRSLMAFKLGVRAVLGERPTPSELLAAIRTVAEGSLMVVPANLRSHLEEPVETQMSQPTSVLTTLTAREHEVLRLLAQGLSNVNIARKLFVSTSTVRSHVHHVLTKLHVNSRAQAVTVAYQAGLMRSAPKPDSVVHISEARKPA